MDEVLRDSDSLKELLSIFQEPSNIYPLTLSVDWVKAALKAYRDIGSIEHFWDWQRPKRKAVCSLPPNKKHRISK